MNKQSKRDAKRSDYAKKLAIAEKTARLLKARGFSINRAEVVR